MQNPHEFERVTVSLDERSYEIVIGKGTLPLLGKAVQSFGFSRRIAVVSNPLIFSLYGEVVLTSLKEAGHDPFPVLIPDGEEYKDYFWSYHLLTNLLTHRLDRKSCLVALGGGVIGDITGFAASVYMRGIPFIQVPTTLLAQVDSSVGGKTGVNHPVGKNMIGSFYQPRLVWIDCDTLATLAPRELRSGLAEVIKYGIIWDSALFRLLVEQREPILQTDPALLARIIRRCCEIKAEVVSRDERESGLRAILNYGHTVGHALETETGYAAFLHGEAVAIGMRLEAELAHAMGLLTRDEVTTIVRLLEAFGLPSQLPRGVPPDKLISLMALDKKAEGGELTIVLPHEIGRVEIHRRANLDMLRKLLSS
jgi:3-dehydroquinate synthase